MFTYYDHCKVNGANELVKKQNIFTYPADMVQNYYSFGVMFWSTWQMQVDLFTHQGQWQRIKTVKSRAKTNKTMSWKTLKHAWSWDWFATTSPHLINIQCYTIRYLTLYASWNKLFCVFSLFMNGYHLYISPLTREALWTLRSVSLTHSSNQSHFIK